MSTSDAARSVDPAPGRAAPGPLELLGRPEDVPPGVAPVPRAATRPVRRRRFSLGTLLGGMFSRASEVFFHTPAGRHVHRRVHSGRDVRHHRLSLFGGDEPRLRAVFLSDLHAGLFMTAADLVALAERVMTLAPDVVLLGGDLVDTRVEQVPLWRDALRVLAPPLGTYAVFGNHDYHRPDIKPALRALLEEHDVRCLENRGHRLELEGASLWLAGVDDLTEGEPDVEAALAGRAPEEPTLLLSHHPDVFHEAAGAGVELQLSGHTHGGQVKLFGWAPIHHTSSGWVEGFFEREGSRLYVGSGTGLTALPLRLGTRSEISLFELR